MGKRTPGQWVQDGWNGFWSGLGAISKNYLTGPNGEAYSLNKLMALVIFLVVMIGYSQFWQQQLQLHRSPAEWALIQQFSLVFLGGVATLCAGLGLAQTKVDGGLFGAHAPLTNGAGDKTTDLKEGEKS